MGLFSDLLSKVPSIQKLIIKIATEPMDELSKSIDQLRINELKKYSDESSQKIINEILDEVQKIVGYEKQQISERFK